MPHKSIPTGRPGIEQISENTYRVGFCVSQRDPLTQVTRRRWVRQTVTYPPTIPHDRQLDMAAAELQRLRAQHNHSVNHTADPDALPAPSEITVGQLVNLWRTTVLPTLSADYRKTAASLIDMHILPHLGRIRCSQLTPLRIDQWTGLLSATPSKRTGRPLSRRTVRHVYIMVSGIFNWGRTHDLILSSPFEKTHAPKVRKSRPKFLDDAQGVELLRHLADVENMSFRAAVMLALMAGLRLGEVDALTWDCIDWEHATIDISAAVHQTPQTGYTIGPTKTDDSIRIISAPASLMALLKETWQYQQDCRRVLGDRWRGSDPGLIVCAWDGSRLNKDTPSKQWKRFAEANGFAGVHFHNLRTSHATILLSNSMDVTSVAGRLGHSDVTTTLTYYSMIVARRDKQSAAIMDRMATTAGVYHSADAIDVVQITENSHTNCTTLQITRKPSK